jgi:hypothetical protein
MDAREIEVRCRNCNAGFAKGTRFCIHCQQPLGARAWGTEPESTADALDVPEPSPEPNTLWSRIGPGAVALLFVALSLVLRMCAGDPSR